MAWDFDIFKSMMPEPIHMVAALPIPVKNIYSRKRSYKAKEAMQVTDSMLKKLQVQWGITSTTNNNLILGEINEEDDNNDNNNNVADDEYESDLHYKYFTSTVESNNNSLFPENVPDVSTRKMLPVCVHASRWLTKLESTKEVLWSSNFTGVRFMQEAVKKLAAPNTNKEYEKRQLKRLRVV